MLPLLRWQRTTVVRCKSFLLGEKWQASSLFFKGPYICPGRGIALLQHGRKNRDSTRNHFIYGACWDAGEAGTVERTAPLASNPRRLASVRRLEKPAPRYGLWFCQLLALLVCFRK
jgi:hypothetical protein